MLFRSVPAQLFPRFPVRPACCLAPSQQSSPQAICMVSHPSSMLPAKLSASYFQGFLSVHHAVSLPPSEALRQLFARFPIRPSCCLAPSQRSSPQAIWVVSYPSSMLPRSLPAKLSASYLRRFLSVQHAVSLPPIDAFRQLFARLSRSFPAELSAQLFARCLIRPACRLAPSQRSFPQANCTVPCPSSMLSRSLPQKNLRKLFPRFPIRPACYLAPSQRSSPQANCTIPCPSSILSRSLPQKTLRKLFARFPIRQACCLAPCQRSSPRAICTVSCPSSTPSRSFPAKLSASYFHGFVSVQHAVSLPPSKALRELCARFPIRPACCLAPSQRSSPHAICTVSHPSSMLSRSLPAKLSASYFHGFLSVQHAISLLPSETLRELFARFPIRAACCPAPSQQSSPQAICAVSYPSSMLSRSLPAKLSASYACGFLSVQHAVSLLPSGALCKLFARCPIRTACCLAPSQQSFPRATCTVPCPSSMLSRPSHQSSPQAISTVSYPSSMLSRSLPAKLSASYLHGFLSVQHAVSLPPSEALRKLFARFPVHPARRLAPSQQSSLQAISTVSYPSSMLSRSLPAKLSAQLFARFPTRPACFLAPSQAKLSASYFHGFLSVQHAISLPPSEALLELFARFPIRTACCLAPSQRSCPKAICTVSCPSSTPSRSFPAKLSASYLHGFVSVQHAVSLPPSDALCPAFCTVSYPSSMLSRSLPAKLSASYLHGFLSVQHAVSLPPTKALRKLFPRFPVRPACCLVPSQRSSPQAICTSPSFLPSFLPRFLPSSLPSFLLSFLPISVQHSVSLPPRQGKLDENPSIGDAFGKKVEKQPVLVIGAPRNACVSSRHGHEDGHPTFDSGLASIKQRHKIRSVNFPLLFRVWRWFSAVTPTNKLCAAAMQGQQCSHQVGAQTAKKVTIQLLAFFKLCAAERSYKWRPNGATDQAVCNCTISNLKRIRETHPCTSVFVFRSNPNQQALCSCNAGSAMQSAGWWTNCEKA